MKKLLMPLFMALILITTGCKAQDDNAISSVKATICSVENDEACAKIKGKQITIDLEDVMILMDDQIVEASSLHDNDTILCTYAKGDLKLIQVIDNSDSPDSADEEKGDNQQPESAKSTN